MCASDRECKIDGTGTSMTGARVVLSLVHSDAKVYPMSYRANQRCSDLSAAMLKNTLHRPQPIKRHVTQASGRTNGANNGPQCHE